MMSRIQGPIPHRKSLPAFKAPLKKADKSELPFGKRSTPVRGGLTATEAIKMGQERALERKRVNEECIQLESTLKSERVEKEVERSAKEEAMSRAEAATNRAEAAMSRAEAERAAKEEAMSRAEAAMSRAEAEIRELKRRVAVSETEREPGPSKRVEFGETGNPK